MNPDLLHKSSTKVQHKSPAQKSSTKVLAKTSFLIIQPIIIAKQSRISDALRTTGHHFFSERPFGQGDTPYQVQNDLASSLFFSFPDPLR
jgi:hypothetical protein